MARKKIVKKKLPAEDLLSKTLPPPPVRPFPVKKVAVVVVLLGLAAIFISNKGLLLAAIVNNTPIFRWQLNRVLVNRYGTQTIDSMVSQALIDQEAQKAGITVSKEEIAQKVTELVSSLGDGVSLDDILKYQGMTKADFEDQIRLQLVIEKLMGKDITIADADIDNYITENREMLTATDEAGLKKEAKQALFSQMVNQKLQPWFSEIKTKAKILRFL